MSRTPVEGTRLGFLSSMTNYFYIVAIRINDKCAITVLIIGLRVQLNFITTLLLWPARISRSNTSIR